MMNLPETPMSRYLSSLQAKKYWRVKMRTEKDPIEKAQCKREFRKARNRADMYREMVREGRVEIV